MASSRVEGRIPWFSSRLGGKFGVILGCDVDLRIPLILHHGSQVSFRVVTGTLGFLPSHCRVNIPQIDLCPETPCTSPVGTGISGLHSRFPWGGRPRLELKQRTLLSSRVAMSISWSPLSGFKGVKAPMEFSEGTWDSSLGPPRKKGFISR